MSRDVTLTGSFNQLVGDETYEMWLKHGDATWALHDAGDLDIDDYEGSHAFVLIALTEGDEYSAQVRLKRAGRYRVGYLTSNPDTWPSQSRADFVPGALADVDAPAINSAVWARTSSTHTKITVSITPFETDKDLKLYRDGVAIHTFSQPLDSTVSYDDVDPGLGAAHGYVAKHVAGSLDGPPSEAVICFAGPVAPDLARTSADDHYGSYVVTWSISDPVEVQDDFMCAGTFSDVVGGTPSSPLTVNVEETEEPEGATQSATFHARARSSVTSFTITDVSDWADVVVEMLIDADNTDYNQHC